MSKCLVIPDVHGQLAKLRIIEDTLFSKVDRIVSLGDWFDSFRPYPIRELCEWLKDHPDIEKLLGNHDCHYFFRGQGWKCSGYSGVTQLIVDEELPHDLLREQFKVSTYVGHYLCTHAGYHPVTFDKHLVEQEALDMAWEGRYSKLWEPGQARGGRAAFGGPTWLDFSYEFSESDDLPRQIVGHTHGKTVRTKVTKGGKVSYCLDTGLRHVAVVDEDTSEVEIVEL